MKIGIDLGTSYSSIAAEINGKIEMNVIDEYIYFTNKSSVAECR